MRAEPTSTGLVLVQERGIALIAALMIMLLMSALMIGFTAVVMSDQRYRGIDKDRLRAYYGAQSGLEKLTTDFGELYFTDLAVPSSKVALLGNNPPVIPGITFVAPTGVTAYAVTPGLIPCPQTPMPTCAASIGTGPYAGLVALKKLYNLDSVARTSAGGEAHLMRQIETVAIPVFQFGTFSDVDLSLFAGGTFTFGGRIHTNGNLFLTAQDGGTTTVTDKVTAVGDVIRQRMQNGLTLSVSNFDGTIKLATAPSTYRTLLATEGSLVDGVGSTPNSGWQPISISTYNGYVRNGGCPPATGCPPPPAIPRGTGAKPLNLALISPIVGGTNTDLARRPPVNEDVNNAVLFGERLFGKVSVRILLSDTAADITSLPTVTATAPIPLGEVLGVAPDWKAATPAGITAVDVTHPPIARAPGGTQGVGGSVIAGLTTGVAIPAGQSWIPWAGALPTAASPYQLHSPNLVTTISKALNVTEYMTCSIVTATQLQQCFPTTAAGALGPLWTLMAAGAKASVTVNGVTYDQTLVENIVVGAATAKTFTITGGIQPYTATAPWGWNTFWVPANDHPNFNPGGNALFNNYPTLVSCTGFTTATSPRFTGCTGTSSNTNSNPTGVPAIALNAPISTHSLHAQNTGLVGGYIKVEIQKADFTWQDVTAEILNYGIAGPSEIPGGANCNNGNPNAILQLQRLKNVAGSCGWSTTATSQDSYDYWPNVMFDSREGLLRDVDPNTPRITLAGVMHYIALDVGNLNKWLKGSAPYGAGSGVNALSNNGYGIYFSDRRNNRADGTNGTTLHGETGEYGFEDVVNPGTAAGTPNGTLDGGEDVNANNAVDLYGQYPSSVNALGQARWNTVPPNGLKSVNPLVAGQAGFDLNTNIRPYSTLNPAQGIVNRTYLFRRALKLVNGGLASFATPGVTGLTVVTENPVYIEKDWNWNSTAALTDPHAETSVIADAVTLLSNNWTDQNSFDNPYDASSRPRTASWYRLAIIGGKGMAFPWPSAGNPDTTFGTDGGAHNFLRYLETGAGTTNYRGAIATFYYSRQAVGTYKFNISGGSVYSAPTRAYAFDTDFLDPAKLPPLTPVFRDINALGFAQEIRPGR